MTSKPVALLLADLGVTKTHARPHVSNDNPFSEAQFKTLKYRPDFPERFGSIQDARAYCHGFFAWYNTEHHHGGLGLLTPARRALRSGRAARGGAGDRARHGLRGASRTIPRRPAATRRRVPRKCGSTDPRPRATEEASCTATPEPAV